MATWKVLKERISALVLRGLYKVADDLEKERMRDNFQPIRLPRSMPKRSYRQSWHFRN